MEKFIQLMTWPELVMWVFCLSMLASMAVMAVKGIYNDFFKNQNTDF